MKYLIATLLLLCIARIAIADQEVEDRSKGKK